MVVFARHYVVITFECCVMYGIESFCLQRIISCLVSLEKLTTAAAENMLSRNSANERLKRRTVVDTALLPY